MAGTIRERDLDALMARLSCGDRSAFDPLYEALRPRAVRLARQKLDEASAGDVAQAALLNVFARASEFSAGRPCLPWFYAIVANEIQARRRRDGRLVLDERPPEPADDRNPEVQLLEREVERAMDLAVDALDVQSANAVRAMLGRTPIPEVAPATFRKRLSRAYACPTRGERRRVGRRQQSRPRARKGRRRGRGRHGAQERHPSIGWSRRREVRSCGAFPRRAARPGGGTRSAGPLRGGGFLDRGSSAPRLYHRGRRARRHRRRYVARALLCAPDVLVLDESFAALDPGTMRAALSCVFERAPALMVVAHP
jgi:RNA polymerase sigma-70 factor (ECF subfamily)